MRIAATIEWTDENEPPRFSVSVGGEDYGRFRDLPNAMTACGFALMEKIEPTDPEILSRKADHVPERYELTGEALDHLKRKLAGGVMPVHAECAACGSPFATRVPNGGDGSVRVLVPHKTNRKWCSGGNQPAIGWGAVAQ